ncbi:SDR family NAD(P)-dependent oxidoreductase [Lutimonas sp.]|uniref:SDR family NAD(P)-dependent oxidoreductase n=1 Tax=Lutimonas sp. TaxID=1872403 RepID=UPI003D9BE3C8
MKTVLVIGGSHGIGRSLIEGIQDSHNIINISRTAPDSDLGIEHYSLDVLADELPQIDSLDGLIYCPGTINLKPMNRLSEEDFQHDFNVNVLGAVRVIQFYMKALKAGRNPSVVLFSTVAVKLGMPFHASIAVSKAGVEALVKTLGAELAPQVRFNGIAPTLTDTNLAEKLLRNDAMREKMKDRHPLKSILEAKDVANLAEFLLSDKSLKMTGQIIQLDCGIVSFKL